tara:strand:- start:52 stop:771 length:720 start_codon:yes stop_codon:yes gene_type:complete
MKLFQFYSGWEFCSQLHIEYDEKRYFFSDGHTKNWNDLKSAFEYLKKDIEYGCGLESEFVSFENKHAVDNGSDRFGGGDDEPDFPRDVFIKNITKYLDNYPQVNLKLIYEQLLKKKFSKHSSEVRKHLDYYYPEYDEGKKVLDIYTNFRVEEMSQVSVDQFPLSYCETYKFLRMFMWLWSKNALLIPEITNKCLDDFWSLSMNIYVDRQLNKDIEKLQKKYSNNDSLSKHEEMAEQWHD